MAKQQAEEQRRECNVCERVNIAALCQPALLCRKLQPRTNSVSRLQQDMMTESFGEFGRQVSRRNQRKRAPSRGRSESLHNG